VKNRKNRIRRGRLIGKTLWSLLCTGFSHLIIPLKDHPLSYIALFSP